MASTRKTTVTVHLNDKDWLAKVRAGLAARREVVLKLPSDETAAIRAAGKYGQVEEPTEEQRSLAARGLTIWFTIIVRVGAPKYGRFRLDIITGKGRQAARLKWHPVPPGDKRRRGTRWK